MCRGSRTAPSGTARRSWWRTGRGRPTAAACTCTAAACCSTRKSASSRCGTGRRAPSHGAAARRAARTLGLPGVLRRLRGRAGVAQAGPGRVRVRRQHAQQLAAAVRRRDAVHQAPQPGQGLRRPQARAALQDGVHGLRGRRVGAVQGVLAGRHQVGNERRDAAPVRAGHRAERHPVRVGPAPGALRPLPPKVGPRPGRRGRQDQPAQGGGHAHREPRLRGMGRDD